MNIASTVSAVADFVTERFPVEKMNFGSMVTKKEVPRHRMSWAYYIGGMTLFFFAVQVATGLLLLFYYEPTVSDAHASVEYITTHVAGGALIRNLHAWSSSAMIFCVIAHLLTTFAMKAFERPREVVWVSGVAMLLLVFAFGFTGYLLPWNQIAVNATKVGLQSIEEVGAYLPGALAELPTTVRETIQGEKSVGQATLSRFYAVHVVVLPLLTLGLLGMHLFGIQLHGMSRGVDAKPRGTERFFPDFMIKDLTVWGVVFFVLFVVALCLPFDAFFAYPLAEPFNPLGSTPEGIKPEWYFLFMFQTLKYLPAKIGPIDGEVLGVLAFGLGGLFWVLVPFLNRTPGHGSRKIVFTIIGVFIVLFIVVMTIVGYLSP